jgi:hypothetical protein
MRAGILVLSRSIRLVKISLIALATCNISHTSKWAEIRWDEKVDPNHIRALSWL